ncbi:MAG: PAS domain S-box protein [Bacillota bacterium]|nr:PAS domain S-box protein [Bacillota bacterium]
MSFLTIESIFAFLVYVFLAVYAINLNKDAKLNRVFAAQCISFAIWCFAYIFMYNRHLFTTREYWLIDLLGAAGWCSYYGISLHFSFVFTGNTKILKNKRNLILIYIPGIVMFISNVVLFRPGAHITLIMYSIYSNINMVLTTVYILSSLFIIWAWGRKTKIGKEKKQAKIIVETGLVSFILGITFQNILPMLGLIDVFMAQIISLIWAFGIFYAITKYKFMNLTSNYAAEYIVSKIEDIVLLLDTDNLITYCNNKVTDILGYEKKDLINKHYPFLFQDLKILPKQMDQTLCICKNGDKIPVKVKSTEIYDKDKDFMGTLIIINDIRENKKLQQEIEDRKKAEASSKNLLDNSGQGFLKIGQDLIIDKEYSQACTKIFDFNVSDKYFPEVLYNDNKREKKAIADNLAEVFNEKDIYAKQIYISSLPSFAIINNKYIKMQYRFIEEKNADKIMVILTDVTKETKLESQLEDVLFKNRESYKLLIQHSMDAIIVQRNGILLFANESAFKLIGYNSQEELQGREIYDLIPADIHEFIRKKHDEINKNINSIISYNSKLLRLDGKIVEVENKSTLIIYEGKPTILSILHDITPEIQMEKLQRDVEKNIKLLNETREMNKLITDFFANVSHELKTPLNVIFAAVQTLNLYNDGSEEHKKIRRKYFNMMKQNCYRLIKLINNLLDITRIDSGFVKLRFQNCNIISIIENITLSVASYVESKGIKLIFDTDVEEKITACDPDKIERIILNIISNSIKFTGQGGEILVNINDQDEGIKISIKDNGIGIPQEKLNSIFERFNQVDKSLSRNREGTGIGLSLVKSLVEMHKGKIEAKSKLGEGSEFIIYLPIIKGNESADENKNYEVDIERINIEFSDIYSENN